MELGIEAARWMVGKALGPVSNGVLEAWEASTELGPNIKALRMELLYAEGMLNNARGQGRSGPTIQKNPALSELLQELGDLAYRADDMLDEIDYFRIQDELDRTYHAAGEHDGGCLRNHALNARHTARAIAKMLGFSKCSGCFATHAEPHEDTRSTRVPSLCGGGQWPCSGVEASNDEEEEDPSKLPDNQTNQPAVDNCCKGMGRITSTARSTIQTVGKHLPLPCYSTQNAANSNGASTGHRLLCCDRTNNKAPQREDGVQPQKLKFDRVDMSRKMKDIVEQLKPLCAKVSTILNLELLAANINNNNGQHMATGRPITTSEPIEPEFYGRKAVISKVLDGIKGKYHDADLTVLPIVGPGGIGKTTLTQHIYKELKDHFEVKLWVCVSVNFSVPRLTQEIAGEINKEGKGSPENEIEEGLKSKRFLLVLDDIWSCNEDEWKRLLVPFKKGQTKGSVILVTTRFPALAEMVKTTDKIDLKGIEKEAFKELFFTYVFGNKKPPEGHSELLDIGEKIIEKLKGSPLAAKTVGRLLRNHLVAGHWTRVLESREWESQSGDHDIMPALKLSFDYLPFHLQQCFAYCSLFPEDYKFSEEEIIHFWIGLDVLHSRGENKKVEDIGLSYLTELFNLGFLKKEEDDYECTWYVIHDLMHELGLKVSADECLSLYSSNVRSIQILPSVRHLSINIDDSSVNDRKAFNTCKEDFSVLGKRLRVENLHSLMLFGKNQGSFANTFRDLFSEAKALRVILISGNFYSMEDVLHNFSKLIHLRYLRVSDDDRSIIYGQNNKLVAVDNISRFYHMRVLDLRGCQDCHNLSRHMTNLSKLRHFLVKDDTMHSKILEVGKLKTLQELKRFEVEKGNEDFELSQIGQLIELCGSLSIHKLENVEGREGADEAKLIHKKNLNELTLNWSVEQSKKDRRACEEQVIEGLKPHGNLQKLSIRGHRGGTCPSWLGLNLSVQNLESLCLDGVDWETFPPIGGELQLVNKDIERKLSNSPSQHLKNLKSIEFANLERLERWVVDSSGQLLSHLEALIIIRCSELVEIVFSDCNYSQQDQKTWPPKLQKLKIQDCPKLSSLPPVPWTHRPCSIDITKVGLVFERLTYGKSYTSQVSLHITGNKETQDSASFWSSLDFDNLTDIMDLWMTECPPLPLDGLQKMSSLKDLSILNCNIASGPVKDGRHASYQFAVESMEIYNVVAISGKELTQVLSYMPKLSELTIRKCGKITGSGVVEQQQQEEAMASSSRRSREEEEEIEEAEEEGLLLLPPQLHDLSIESCTELRLCPLDPALCCLRSLSIENCPKFLSCYAPLSSSSFSFPSSLQSLHLDGVEILSCSGHASGMSLGRLLAHSCLQELTVLNSTSFFEPNELLIPSSRSTLLSSLETDDVPGVLAAPVCRLLSSTLTKLALYGNEEMECFTVEQDDSLQLLTSLQHLHFENLQSLPSGLQRLTSLKKLKISRCPSIRTLPSDSLPNSLQHLTIAYCSAIHSLPSDSLPNSLQHLTIAFCSAIRSLDSLPNSLQNLCISFCSAIRSLDNLPNSLQDLTIRCCSAIRSIDSFPNSLQEICIQYCPSLRSLPKGVPPTSLKLIDVSFHNNNTKLQRHCRKLIGAIPIVKLH